MRYRGAKKDSEKLALLSKYIFKGLAFVMLFTPIGAFGGMVFTTGKYGIATLLLLGRLMLTVYVTIAVFIFVVLGLILRFY